MGCVGLFCSYGVFKTPHFLQYPETLQTFHNVEVMLYCLTWRNVLQQNRKTGWMQGRQ